MAITKIAEVTVGAGGAASIDFTSIPGTYSDLMVVLSQRGDSGTAFLIIELNGDTSYGSYSNRYLRGDGSSAVSGGIGDGNEAGWNNSSLTTANTFGNTSYYIANYSITGAKAVGIDTVRENNATSTYLGIEALKWGGTAVINRLTIKTALGGMVQYSSATLYGITKGSSGGVTVS